VPTEVRWTGIAQAQLQPNLIQSVRNGASLTEIATTTIQLPWNIPVYPNENDLMTFELLEGVILGGGNQLVLETRAVNQFFVMAGYITVIARVS
jgi:hypothetical protein